MTPAQFLARCKKSPPEAALLADMPADPVAQHDPGVALAGVAMWRGGVNAILNSF